MAKPLEAALDLFVYAPVGLAITAAEELPKLAAKGRDRVNTQMAMAKVVGQFAVAQGRKQLERRWAPTTAPTASPTAPVPEEGVETPDITYEDLIGGNGQAPGTRWAGFDPGRAAPRSTELAIPGYDSLSASQVVQRLAGLSEEELAAVGAYEQAHRARRTILNRISQLQGR